MCLRVRVCYVRMTRWHRRRGPSGSGDALGERIDRASGETVGDGGNIPTYVLIFGECVTGQACQDADCALARKRLRALAALTRSWRETQREDGLSCYCGHWMTSAAGHGSDLEMRVVEEEEDCLKNAIEPQAD